MKTKILFALILLFVVAGAINVAIQYTKWVKLQEPYPMRWLGSPVYLEGGTLMNHPAIEFGYRSDGVVIWRVRDTNTVAQ